MNTQRHPVHGRTLWQLPRAVNALRATGSWRFTEKRWAKVPRRPIAGILRALFSQPCTTMKIEKDRVVRFHYTLFDADTGVELESSREREALAFLAGRGGIIAGLETAFEGKQAGESFEATVAPEQAYGPRHENAVQRIPKKHFGSTRLEAGVPVMLRTQQGPRMVVVKKVGMSVVDVDLNHPMAGKNLRFAVDVVDVREATAEEISHGHAHGVGGHQHG